MLNINPEIRYDDSDALMLEVEAALLAMPLHDAPANLNIIIAANIARYEMNRAAMQPDEGLTVWGWLDRAIATITRPLVMATAAFIVGFWLLFVANDPTWVQASSQLNSVGDKLGAAVGIVFSSLGQFYPALIVGMVLVAAVALIPRVRDLRQMLREEQAQNWTVRLGLTK